MAGLLSDIRQSFHKGNNMVRKLMFINIGVFIFLNLLIVVSYLTTGSKEGGRELAEWIMLPANPIDFLYRPWTLFTYMFAHIEIWHIFFNMLWLYFMGNLFMEFLGNQKLLRIYIYGGLAGGILYLLGMNVFPVFRESAFSSGSLLGASAGVMAVIVGIAVLIPNYAIRIIFFDVKLKYIAFFEVVISIISMYGSNPGGNLAHIGGALVGYFYIRYLREHTWFDRFENTVGQFWRKRFRSRRSKKKIYHTVVTHMKVENTQRPDQSEVDAILDKINMSGYESLSQKERETLFKASKQD
ncbi:MAG: rhomboid family intramembrane serine protease [Bacteroidetes bacterium]|nr:rhomboid family intramembrane serine protease [Bacteroidota bacterium]